jgi:hypothetical protein
MRFAKGRGLRIFNLARRIAAAFAGTVRHIAIITAKTFFTVHLLLIIVGICANQLCLRLSIYTLSKH